MNARLDRKPTGIVSLTLTSLALLAALLLAGVSPSEAAKCGGNGQKACAAIKPGPVCQKGLGKFDKICRPCGKKNQRACPAIERGRQCAKGLVKDGRYCRGCGGNGERSCPVAMKGRVCDAGLGKFDKVCRPCGGPDQRACPGLEQGKSCRGELVRDGGMCRSCGGNGEIACPVARRGHVCEDGLGKLDGRCRPCGREGQRACPALEAGRRCQDRLVEHENLCRSCGGQGEPSCPVVWKGRICHEGLGKFDGLCQPCGERGQPACPGLEQGRKCERGTRRIDGVCQACGGEGQIMCPMVERGRACGENLLANPKTRICEWSWKIARVPFRIFNRSDDDAFYSVGWYAPDGLRMIARGSLEAGAERKVSLAGLECSEAPEINDLNQSPVPHVIEWANREDTCADERFQVFFWDREADYRSFRTDQWLAANYASNFELAGLVGEQRLREGIFALFAGTRPDGELREFGVHALAPGVAQQHRWVAYWGEDLPAELGRSDVGRVRSPEGLLPPDQRSPRTISVVDSDGMILDVCYEESCSQTVAEGAIDVLGLWDFVWNGKALTDEFIEQTGGHVVLRRYGTTKNRRYELVGPNLYRNTRGSEFRFTAPNRAVWTSPDRATVLHMTRRELSSRAR